MVSIALFSAKAFTILAYALTVQAAALPARQDKGSGFVKLPIKKAASNATILAEGPTSSPITLSSNQAGYYIQLDVGSQAQSVSVILDTGSSDLWIADQNSISGGFDNTASTTYHDLGEPFSIGYDLGSATGEYVTDTVAIPGGPSLSNFQFADVSTPNPIGAGILGIGYGSIEATGDSPKYSNFPQALKDAGYISKNAYSLYLNSIQAGVGEIIFGGIDTAKFDGSLSTIPVQDPENGFLQASIDSFTTPDGTVISVGVPGDFDSGTTWTFLPDDTVSKLANDLGYPIVGGGVSIPCGTTLNGDLTFTFSGVSLTVPLQDLLFPLYKNGNCGLSIIQSSQNQNSVIIGDSLLRYFYVLYDLDDNTLGLAQAKYTTDSNIVPVS